MWLKRYRAEGEAGLVSRSQRPKHSPNQKVTAEHEQWILDLRKRRLGARRIQNELARLHEVHLSLRTIHKVLTRHNVKPLTRRRRQSSKIGYQRDVPGERVQMDNMKLADDLFQYTAIDDCTRIKVVGLYPSRSADSSLQFLEEVRQSLPFPIQRLQTDRGQEFFAYSFQDRLAELRIKFRPNKPASPHLNGKVERTQRTDWDEFYPTVELDDPDLLNKLKAWQEHYNHSRPHGSLKGKTPWEKWLATAHLVPSLDVVHAAFDPKQETAKTWNYNNQSEVDRLRALKATSR
jgi:transposase InsO family protein